MGSLWCASANGNHDSRLRSRGSSGWSLSRLRCASRPAAGRLPAGSNPNAPSNSVSMIFAGPLCFFTADHACRLLSWGLFGAAWGLLGPLGRPGVSWGGPGAFLGPPGAFLGPPVASWGLLWPPVASWGLSGVSWGVPGPPGAVWCLLGSPGASWACVCLSVCLSVCLFVCLSVCLSVSVGWSEISRAPD